MPQYKKQVHPVLSAIVLVSAAAITGVLYLMHQAIVVAEDLTSAVNTLNERLEEKL
ncbi:MAG: hypothetical protein RJA61_532 [Candidatus Parcubacteria bacterium]|jgi:hypothetical protein